MPPIQQSFKMSSTVNARLKIVPLVLQVLFYTQYVTSKPGIDTIRRQYGLSGVLPYNETIVGPIVKPEDSRKKPELRMDTDGWGNADYDADYYDEPMGRSLFPVEEKPSVAQSLPIGKCRVEVLTSSLVKSNSRIPPGNGSNGYLSIIETCCQGYEPYVHNKNQCVPVCRKPCINGICTQPDVCECFPDHVKSLNGDCVATCPIFCLNGHCHSNGACTCKPGYVHEPNKMFCVPHCPKACGEFFNCSAPEICTCLKGYEYNHLSRRCDPVCFPPCGSGTCVRPNECSCIPGFNLINGTCQANCSRPCEKGRCVANGVCACDSGWTLDQTGFKCEPHCAQGCVNGKCTAPGVCECKKGYEKQYGNCKPHCSRGCINGKCTAPGVCSCRPGYYLETYLIAKNRCKKTKNKVIVVSDHRDPIFNPSVVVQPIRSAPIFNPPAFVQPGISSPINAGIPGNLIFRQPNFQTAAMNQSSIQNTSSVNGQPIPSAPNTDIYERQPAFNPLFSENSPPNAKPNYLEQQSAFNPHFNNNKSTQRTLYPTTRYIKPKSTRQPKMNEVTKKPFSLLDLFRTSRNTTEKHSNWKTTTPKPKCDKACLNGRCTGRNHCTCNSGYTMTSGSHHKCVAHCSKGCPHGSCTSPGHCTCNFGYKKRNNKCVKS